MFVDTFLETPAKKGGVYENVASGYTYSGEIV